MPIIPTPPEEEQNFSSCSAHQHYDIHCKICLSTLDQNKTLQGMLESAQEYGKNKCHKCLYTHYRCFFRGDEKFAVTHCPKCKVKSLDRDHWDKEIVSLCNALNAIPFIQTFDSCSGHEKNPIMIWLRCTDYRYLYPIGRALDRRYNNCRFDCLLDVGDIPGRAVAFLLESEDEGEKAYLEAERLAVALQTILGNTDLMRTFGLDPEPPSAAKRKRNRNRRKRNRQRNRS